MKVLAIIVTYNGMQWHERCFSSLEASTIPVDTFVVDNASSDDTVSYIKTNFPKVILVESKINLGFGQANNKGMKYALENGYDFVFLLNQDAWVEPNTIEVLVQLHKENKEYGILSPMHLVAEKDKLEESFSNFIVPPYSPNDFTKDLYFGNKKEIYSSNFINAAAWLLPIECLKTVGGFDPIFFHYQEDFNYTQRVLFHGFKIGFCPTVSIVHDCTNRVMEQRHIDGRYLNLLMSEMIDVNNITAEKEINMLMLNRFLKMIGFLLRFKINKLKEAVEVLSFLVEKRKYMMISLKRNRVVGANYLE